MPWWLFTMPRTIHIVTHHILNVKISTNDLLDDNQGRELLYGSAGTMFVTHQLRPNTNSSE